jgi:hypothetical protein
MPIMYDSTSPAGVAHQITGVLLSFNILFNYAMCVRTDPGSPPDLFDAAEDGALDGVGGAPAAAGGDGAAAAGGARGAAGPAPRQRWCRKCHNHKPPLAHHCSVCRHARSAPARCACAAIVHARAPPGPAASAC